MTRVLFFQLGTCLGPNDILLIGRNHSSNQESGCAQSEPKPSLPDLRSLFVLFRDGKKASLCAFPTLHSMGSESKSPVAKRPIGTKILSQHKCQVSSVSHMES